MPVSYFRVLELLSLTCFKFGEKLPHKPDEKGNFTNNLSFLSFSCPSKRVAGGKLDLHLFFFFALFWGRFKKNKQTNKKNYTKFSVIGWCTIDFFARLFSQYFCKTTSNLIFSKGEEKVLLKTNIDET